MYTHDIDYVIRTLGVGATYRGYPVSYTHLDVYKRQLPADIYFTSILLPDIH